MKAWAIDVYGLREAHRRSVLGRSATPRLYVSPLTWFPGQPARTGNGKSPRRTAHHASENLTLVGGTHAVHRPPRQVRCMRPSTHFTSEACSSSTKATNATRTCRDR